MGNRVVKCALGRSGRSYLHRESDGASPIGRWPMRYVLYRPDRISRPQTALPVKQIHSRDGWCDDPENRNYNRPVPLPYGASAESLWREDRLYDIIIPLDFNDSRRSTCYGSAIFMHIASADFSPTEGCVALGQADLLWILRYAGPGSSVEICP